MTESESFLFRGRYRVQSYLSNAPSLLAGQWMSADSRLLTSEIMNASLARRRAWRGVHEVALTAALIQEREGTFAAEPDVLYKRDLFTPDPDSAVMHRNIVDIHKSTEWWRRRRPHAVVLFGEEVVTAIEHRTDDLRFVIANEYFCHEAGHMLGLDVLTKQADGYFRLSGRFLWPLVYVEEFRADMQSFGFALELLPRTMAASLFLYHLVTRMTVATEARRGDGKGYGSVPYLLFCQLSKCGFLRADQTLHLSGLDDDTIAAAMDYCSEHALAALTAIENEAGDPIDAALNAAAYYRAQSTDEDALAAFASLAARGDEATA